MVEIAGRRYCLWCLKNVPGDMQAQLNMLNILRALVGSAPAKRISADRRIFPLVCCLSLVGYPIPIYYGTLNMLVLFGGGSH